MVELKIIVVIPHVTIMLLWTIEPKIDWNRSLQTIESNNLVWLVRNGINEQIISYLVGRKGVFNEELVLLELAQFVEDVQRRYHLEAVGRGYLETFLLIRLVVEINEIISYFAKKKGYVNSRCSIRGLRFGMFQGMFHYLALQLSHFCQNPICLSKIGQIAELPTSKST